MIQGNKKSIFAQIEPSERLFNRVFLGIELEKEKMAKRKTFAFGIISLLSLFATLFSGNHFVEEFYNSGTYSYVSILFSDFEMISYFWKELLVSIAETLPVLSATAILASLMLFLVFTKETIKNILSINGLNIRTV